MQTFSNMRRDSVNQKNIKLIGIFILLVVYESISSIYPFLSPLFGVIFIYALTITPEPKNNLKQFLLFAYIIIYEIDKDFIVLSFIVFLLFSKKFVIERVDRVIGCEICKISIFVTYAYLGYYALNLLFSTMFSQYIPYLGVEYIFYILTDIVLIMLFMM